MKGLFSNVLGLIQHSLTQIFLIIYYLWLIYYKIISLKSIPSWHAEGHKPLYSNMMTEEKWTTDGAGTCLLKINDNFN